MENKNNLSPQQVDELLITLKARFQKNMNRHKGLDWETVHLKLEAAPKKLWSLFEMERTGGEPDVVIPKDNTNAITFYDCSAETPKGRRSLCYDREALDDRKEYKPADCAVDMTIAIGIELLDEQQYQALQQFGPFDTKTSSWIKTGPEVRKLGGALFGDYRYGRVFIYHNGASSYYAARGFRGCLKL
jgi:hypothetical protein